MKYAEQLVEKEASAQVAAIRIDCSDAKSIKDAFEAVNSLGTVDVLVCFLDPFLTWTFNHNSPINRERSAISYMVSCLVFRFPSM